MHDRKAAFYRNVLAQDSPRDIELISEGIKTTLVHVSSLLADADLLFDHERFALARFVVATADEEMGKVHILIEAARLGPARRKDARLEKAFYDHIAKFAYSETWRARRDLEKGTFAFVEQTMDVNLVKEWPGSPQNGEPGHFPHDTYVHREMRLYVDYQDYGGGWTAPTGYRDEFESWFRNVPSLREKSRAHLSALELSRDLGLFEVTQLLRFNEIWRSSCYFGRRTNEDQKRQLEDLRNKTAGVLAGLVGCEPSVVSDSPLCFWPCYGFLDAIGSEPSETLLERLVAPRIGYP
jgi:AbiV family abortive infection protein